MEARQLRLLVVLTAVLAAAVAVLWLAEPPGEERDEDATAQIAAGFEPAQAVRVRIERSPGSDPDVVGLAKQDGMWFVTEPYQAPADVDRTIAVLRVLGQLKWGVPVQGQAESFGLEPPVVRATVTLEGGEEHTYTFGSTAPVGYRSYMRAQDGSVAAVDGKPSEELLKRVAEYRDHRVFTYAPGDVVRASITSTFGTLQARKLDEGWFLDGFGRADLDAIDNWVTEMLNLRVDLFLDLDDETIDQPLYIVEVETTEATQRLLVGRDTPYGKLVMFGDGLDGVIPHEILQMLERGPSDVGVTHAFPFEPTSDTRIVLSGAREADFTQLEGEWTAPFEVLEVFRQAQYVYKLEPPALDEPDLIVRFEGSRGERVVEIGPAVEGFRAVRERPGEALRVPVEELAPLFQE